MEARMSKIRLSCPRYAYDGIGIRERRPIPTLSSYDLRCMPELDPSDGHWHAHTVHLSLGKWLCAATTSRSCCRVKVLMKD